MVQRTCARGVCVPEMPPPPPPPRQFIRQRVIRIGAAPVSAAADAFEKRSRTTHKSATADASQGRRTIIIFSSDMYYVIGNKSGVFMRGGRMACSPPLKF